MAAQAKTISFRLSPRNTANLETRASRSGKTPGELARAIVVGVLDDENETEILKLKIGSLEQQIKSLHRGLSNLAEAILVVYGNVPKDDARAWVKDNIG